MFGQLDQHRVILEVEPEFQEDSSTLQNLYVRTANGQMMPLSVLIKPELSVSPLTINHQDQFPSVTLSFNLAPGYSLGDALTAIQNVERSLAKPASLTARFQGSAKVFETSLSTQPYLIAAAIIAVYIVLGILYESFIHPITILSTLPSAGVGRVPRADGAALRLLADRADRRHPAGRHREEERDHDDRLRPGRRARAKPRRRRQSIYEACLLRFRPIMMTTMAALLGGLPLALGTGAGSELRRPLGIAIVGGLLLSQFLTLYTTPVVYIYLAKFGAWLRFRADRADSRRVQGPERELRAAE